MPKRQEITLVRYLRDCAGPSPAFWDEVWRHSPTDLDALAAQADPRLVRKCTEYLSPQATILEGGCGSGSYLAAFSKLGYRVVGVDFAPQTVRRLKQWFPALDVRQGDIRHLPFDRNSFDAYYSGGVIEHFVDGLEPQIAEARRVLKTGGVFLVTVPYLNPVRRLAAWLFGPREKMDLDGRDTFIAISYGDPPVGRLHGVPPDGYVFHEYVLAPNRMRRMLADSGFVVEDEMPFSARWGLLDVGPLRRLAGIGLARRHIGNKIGAAPLRIVDVLERNANSLAHLIGVVVGNLRLYVARKRG